jgi:uncharacterized protein (TIRG00374 family)
VNGTLRAGLKIAVSLGGLAFLFFFFRDRLPAVIRVLKNFDPYCFALAAFFFLLGFFILTVRLQWILKARQVRLSGRRLLYFNFIGHFFSLFLPSAIGGDVVKGYYIYRDSREKVISFTSIFLDRMVGSFGILTFALAALIYYGKSLNLVPLRNAVLITFGAALAAFAFFLSRKVARSFRFLAFFSPPRKIADWLRHAYHHLNAYKDHKALLGVIFAVSLAGQAVFITVHYFLARSLKVDLPYLTFFLVIPVVTALSMAPSINGLGVREAGSVYLFSRFTSTENALALSIAYDGLVYGMGLLFGLLYLAREGFFSVPIREAEDMEKEVERIEEAAP